MSYPHNFLVTTSQQYTLAFSLSKASHNLRLFKDISLLITLYDKDKKGDDITY